jgi:N-acetylmuramoyl-L-alanine amidase
MRELADIKKIIVHCSDSEFGDMDLIDAWHKERGWKGCGYHFVITNGIRTKGAPYNPNTDGQIEEGRALSESGAHCKGHNRESIGICLIGKHHFTGRQLYHALPRLLRRLTATFKISVADIYGHCEFSPKTCPNIDPDLIRIAI